MTATFTEHFRALLQLGVQSLVDVCRAWGMTQFSAAICTPFCVIACGLLELLAISTGKG